MARLREGARMLEMVFLKLPKGSKISRIVGRCLIDLSEELDRMQPYISWDEVAEASPSLREALRNLGHGAQKTDR